MTLSLVLNCLKMFLFFMLITIATFSIMVYETILSENAYLNIYLIAIPIQLFCKALVKGGRLAKHHF